MTAILFDGQNLNDINLQISQFLSINKDIKPESINIKLGENAAAVIHFEAEGTLIIPLHDLAQRNDASDALIFMGIPAHYKGYWYLQHAIELLNNDPMMMEKLTRGGSQGLYTVIAQKYDSSWKKVEHAIHMAIQAGWGSGKMATYLPWRTKPSNGAFLATLVEKLRMKLAG